ncbi:hypothetical protein A6V36_08670 [Paraburkholderia ginsengiterrae]|uniref:Uncharacterized protein n=1 Tax=Paraburkholderia ginsengiterrae TaxID=1462993 RepID=A0A1A9N903_9BURK|nr:hypothetical protein A6V36_08670 [Paraburkholderia ginsengiterrae]OAJ61084.1 hypothetical protein A6V37_03005 [Paraburkholderia ginsengiterrae]
MAENDEGKMSAIEKAALNTLAIGVGILVAFVIWGALFNLLTYHSLFQPRHPVADGVVLGGGFMLIATLPALIILLPMCVIASLRLFQKLR